MFRLVNKMKNKKGFTLIELIIVLAILGIIAAIAVPRFQGIQKQAKIDADEASAQLIEYAAEIYFVSKDVALTEQAVNSTCVLVTDGYLDGVPKTASDTYFTVEVNNNGDASVSYSAIN